MKLRTWIVVGVLSVGVLGCGRIARDEGQLPGETPLQDVQDQVPEPEPIIEPTPEPEPSPSVDPNPIIPVIGANALYGSKCQDGTVVPPQVSTDPMVLEDCPINLNKIELVENLAPITLQADCKKRFLDIQKSERSSLTSWEFMPDGTFDIIIDGGNAKFKEDGAGGQNCSVTTAVELVGRVDCTDVFKPQITIDTYWWLDETQRSLVPSPSPTPSPSPSESPTPSPTVSPSPTPSVSVSPRPSTSPTPIFTRIPFPDFPFPFPSARPSATPTRSPRPIRTTVPSSDNHGITNKCNFPNTPTRGCKLHNQVKILQCS